MKKEKSQKVLLSGIAMVVLFILWTVAISLIDVQPIGPQNSSVGFATLNGFIHSLTGVHMAIYTVTDWLGLIPLCFILGFALLGLIQLIKRKNCNDKQFLESENPEVLLPHFSCHSLRHTFTTRMCEAGVNVKVIQDALGHKDVSTTLNIYTDVTKELRKSEFEGLELQFNQ